MIKLKPVVIILTAALLLIPVFSVAADEGCPVMTREEFDNWPNLPEYTIFNPFPSKGSNCTWYAHGRMMQLGYCPYALDSMRFSAYRWADDADRGAEVVEEPVAGSIAFWDSEASFGGSLGHVGVVEKIKEDGSILVSDSSSSRNAYNLFSIAPDDRRWPTAFITVPEGPERSQKFSSHDTVQTTASNLYFRLEGVDQDPVLVPQHTEALIKAHPSNGIFASQAWSTSSYHYWWYAAVEIEGEIKYGWLAETYLEFLAAPDPEQNQDEKDSEKDQKDGSDQEEENTPKDTDESEEAEQGENTETEDENDSLPEPDRIPGDIDGDGKIDVLDVTLAMQYVLNIVDLTGEQVEAADLNDDGIVDVRDVVLIMQRALGLDG